MAAALRPGHGVDLVHDHVLDGAQDLARRRGQQQVQRLRCRHQDVGRVASQVAAVRRRRVPGAGRDPDVGRGEAAPLGLEADAGERGPEVALDVVSQRLERRDVQHAQARLLVDGSRGGRQTVDHPQEGGQRLARSRGGEDQAVLAAADGVPALLLRGSRPVERAREPLPGHRREAVERRHAVRL